MTTQTRDVIGAGRTAYLPAARRPGSRRKRVLVVHSSDEMYGSDRIVLEIVDELVSNDDVDVTVWLPRDVEVGPLGPLLRDLGARVEHQPVPILRRSRLTPFGLLRLVRDAGRTLARLSEHRFDLVYCATSACLVVAPLARLTGVRHVIGHLQEPWGRGDRLGLAPLARACTAFVAVSHSVLGSSGLSEDARAVVVHNGVPHRPRDLPESTLGAHPRLELDRPAGGRPRFVVASRWNAHKGHGTLLAAWEAAGCPGELVVLGGPPALGSRVDVVELVDRLVSRPETVRVIGEVADASPYLRDADCVVLPTDTLEGFGLVVLEAFREGRPVIASRSGGPEEVVVERETGWLFDCQDVDALADLLRSLDLETLRAAGLRAEQAYLTGYTPEHMRRNISAVVSHELRGTRLEELVVS